MLDLGLCSDLSRDDNASLIRVIAPRMTWRADPRERANQCEEVYDDIINLRNLKHIGLLRCSPNGNSRCNHPWRLEEGCCGDLKWYVAPKQNLSSYSLRQGMVNVCCCSGCEMVFGFVGSKSELQFLLLHMMLKQMIPDYFNTLNFVDCTMHVGEGREHEDVTKLGVVSVALDKIVIPRFQDSPDRASLGFVFDIGMDTRRGGGEYLPWLQCLIGKKMEQLVHVHQSTKQMLLGPPKG